MKDRKLYSPTKRYFSKVVNMELGYDIDYGYTNFNDMKFNQYLDISYYNEHVKHIEKLENQYYKIEQLILEETQDKSQQTVFTAILCMYLSSLKDISFVTIQMPSYEYINGCQMTPYILNIRSKSQSIKLFLYNEIYDTSLDYFFNILRIKIDNDLKKLYNINSTDIRKIIIKKSLYMLEWELKNLPKRKEKDLILSIPENAPNQFYKIVGEDISFFKIIRDFYNDNFNNLDSVDFTNEHGIINFSNNKSIIFENKKFIDNIDYFLENVRNDLITKKLEKKGRSY